MNTLLKSPMLAIAALVFALDPAVCRSEKIPYELFERAAAEGNVLVLVGLGVPWIREDKLSQSAVLEQRQAIDRMQERLLEELFGTRFRIVVRYQVIPGIALDVGADALAVLQSSEIVTNVVRDRPGKPAAADGRGEGTPEVRRPEEGNDDPGLVPAELFVEAKRDGRVLVLVGLKAPWSPEEGLKEELVLAQRQAIAASQNYLLAELAHTGFRITRLYEVIPGIALEVELDALRVLARSAAVTSVLRDGPAR